MKQLIPKDDLETGDVKLENDRRVLCTNCNGKGKDIVDMGGPDCEVDCRQCNGTGWEPA